jgi:hypothetical protein
MQKIQNTATRLNCFIQPMTTDLFQSLAGLLDLKINMKITKNKNVAGHLALNYNRRYFMYAVYFIIIKLAGMLFCS